MKHNSGPVGWMSKYDSRLHFEKNRKFKFTIELESQIQKLSGLLETRMRKYESPNYGKLRKCTYLEEFVDLTCSTMFPNTLGTPKNYALEAIYWAQNYFELKLSEKPKKCYNYHVLFNYDIYNFLRPIRDKQLHVFQDKQPIMYLMHQYLIKTGYSQYGYKPPLKKDLRINDYITFQKDGLLDNSQCYTTSDIFFIKDMVLQFIDYVVENNITIFDDKHNENNFHFNDYSLYDFERLVLYDHIRGVIADYSELPEIKQIGITCQKLSKFNEPFI